eukprot:388903_1
MAELKENVVNFNQDQIYDLAFIYGIERHMIKSINNFASFDGAVYHINIHSKYHSTHKSLVIKCSKIISFKQTDLILQAMILFNENNIPCPKPIKIMNKTTDNKHKFIHITSDLTNIHCMEYIKGVSPSKLTKNTAFYRHLGNTVGNISKCLENFDHSSAHFEFEWDIRNTHKTVESDLKYIKNNIQKRNLINYYLNEFNTIIKPKIKYLKHSVIHGDINESNMLCDIDNNNNIVAIFDFDSHYTCTVFEISICCSYFMCNQTDTKKGIQTMLEIVYGYNEIYPLNALEIDVIWTAICCRMVISAMEGFKYIALNPQKEFIAEFKQLVWDFLERYSYFTAIEMTKLIKKYLHQCENQSKM